MSSPVPPTSTAPGPEAGPAGCPRCGAAATGRFCADCGAPLDGARCSGCGAPLTPGARFCHHCGTTAGPGALQNAGRDRGGMATTLPWAVAGIAFLALFAMLAGRGFNARRGSALDAPANALPNPTLDAPAMGGAAGAGSPGVVRAPDISSMTPQQLADRLFDRIMRLADEGKRDSVQFFAPMGVQAYQMVRDQQGRPFDADQRYDMGRIALVAGAFPLARAQADTILQQHPDHLLGLLLAGEVAQATGNASAAREYAARFRAARAPQLAKGLPEYARHRREIDAGL